MRAITGATRPAAGGHPVRQRTTHHASSAPVRGAGPGTPSGFTGPGGRGPSAAKSSPGLAGQVTIYPTNAYPSRNEAFGSLAAEVKSFAGDPVAKSFSLNFAVLYDPIAAQRARPGSFYATADGARDITEQLITYAGYDPAPLGGPDKARGLEDLTWLLSAGMKDGASIFYRFAVPGEL